METEDTIAECVRLLDLRPSDHTARLRLSRAYDAIGDRRGLGYWLLAMHRRNPKPTDSGTWVWLRENLPSDVTDNLKSLEYKTRQQADDACAIAFANWIEPQEKTPEGNF